MSDNIREESILKTIKAINERMAVYERQGLTDSYYYRKMQERIRLEGLPLTTSKEGELRISRSKSALEEISEQSLKRINNLPSLKEERKRLRASGIKDIMEQNKQIQQYGDLQKWCEDNLDDLYDDELSGLAEADTLTSKLKEGLRTYDYDRIFAMISKYEEAKAKSEEIFSDSKWTQGIESEIADSNELPPALKYQIEHSKLGFKGWEY